MKTALIAILMIHSFVFASVCLQGPTCVPYGDPVTVNIVSTDTMNWNGYIAISYGSFESCTTYPQAGSEGGNIYYPTLQDDAYYVHSAGLDISPSSGIQHSVNFIMSNYFFLVVELLDENFISIDRLEIWSGLDPGITANAGGPYLIYEGQSLVLDGSESTICYSGTIYDIAYCWEIDGISVGMGERLEIDYINLPESIRYGSHNVALTFLGMYGSSEDPLQVRSDAQTTLEITCTFNITSPKNGDAWNSGGHHTIQWTTLGIAANVNIEYSVDSGSNWTLVDQTTNSGSYNWIVPEHSSPTCLIRISDATDDSVVETSDMFTIYECTLLSDLNKDCFVNLEDFSILALNWLACGDPFDLNCNPFIELGITWVYVENDPGVSGHEGFSGYMSKYETTNRQYCEFLNAALASGDIIVDGSYAKGAGGSNSGADFVGQVYYDLAGSGTTYNGATNGGAARINYSGGVFTVDSGFENHPVTYISWYGATAFADYYGWRLPTEWEWQAVADYDGTFTYGCGTSIDNSIANYFDSVHPDGTTIVGAFGAYGYGMCDMAGNAWEWTDSCYNALCNLDYRVLRGGGWYYNGNDCTVSNRIGNFSPTNMFGHFGFRVCR